MRWYKWLCLVVLVLSTPVVIQSCLATPERIAQNPVVGITMLIGALIIPAVCLFVLFKKKKK